MFRLVSDLISYHFIGESTEESVEDVFKKNVTSVAGGFLCLPCGKVISRRNNAKRHVLDQHCQLDIEYLCPLCKITISKKSAFQDHIYKKHRELKSLNVATCQVPKDRS